MQALNNSIDNFKYGFEDAFLQKLIDRIDDNRAIFEKILDDKEFGDTVKAWMLKSVYKKIVKQNS